MAIKVVLFGQLVDMAGAGTLEFEGVTDTASLQEQLHGRMPALAGATYRIAVNKTIIKENTAVPDGAAVALLPPFSGG